MNTTANRPANRLNWLMRSFTTPLEPSDLLRTFLPVVSTRGIGITPEIGLPPSVAGASPTVRWGDVAIEAPGNETILELLEARGEQPAVGCRRGVCRRCISPLISGRVHDRRDDRDLDAGTHVRICVSAPVTDVVLEPTESAVRVPVSTTAGGAR